MDLADMRGADFMWVFARLARLRVFRISGSDMGDAVIEALSPFPVPWSGKGKGKARDEKIEEEDSEPKQWTEAEGTGSSWSVRLPHLEHLELRACVRLSPAALVNALIKRVRFTDACARAHALVHFASWSNSMSPANPTFILSAAAAIAPSPWVSAPVLASTSHAVRHGAGRLNERDGVTEGEDQNQEANDGSPAEGGENEKAKEGAEVEKREIRTLRTLTLVDCALQPEHIDALVDAFGARVQFVA